MKGAGILRRPSQFTNSQFAILGIIGLPLSYYTGFVLPHRYGQSVETLRQWIIDHLKGLPIGAVIGLVALEIIYWVLRVSPDANGTADSIPFPKRGADIPA